MMTIEQKNIIKKEYLEGINYSEIAKKLGFKKHRVFKYLQNSDFYIPIKKLGKRFTKEDTVKMIEIYNSGKTIKDISKIFNVSFNRINGFLSKKIKLRGDYKICNKKYSCDFSFFENINTEEKAYILGILYADGCNQLNEGDWSITLQENDIDILFKIKNAIKSNHNLIYIKKHKESHQNYYKLSHRNKKMCEDLNILGCTPRKSLTLKFPSFLNKELIRHFIRGYFDGDGHIGICFKNNGPYEKLLLNIMSTNDFILEMLNFINNEINISGKVILCKNNITAKYVIYGDIKIITFLNWIYKDSSIHMDRKYNKYLQAIDSRINRGLTLC